VRGNSSPYNRSETLDETAEMISSAGGSAIALRVDHTVEREVEEVFGRVVRERGRLDILGTASPVKTTDGAVVLILEDRSPER